MAWLLKQLAEAISNAMLNLVMQLVSWWTDIAAVDTSTVTGLFNNSLTVTEYARRGDSTATMNVLDFINNQIILPVSIAIVLLILVIFLYRAIFSKNGSEVDDPLHLVGWSCFSLFMIAFWGSFETYIFDLFDKIRQPVSTMISGLRVGGSSINDYDAQIGNITTLWDVEPSFDDAENIAYGLKWIASAVKDNIAAFCWFFITIVIFFMLGQKLLNLMLLYVSRYVQYWAVMWLAPLGFSCFGSRRTQDISRRYIRLIVSSFAAMLMTEIFTYLYIYLMFYTLAWQSSNGAGFGYRIFLVCVCMAFYELIGRIDFYLMQLGLTNVQSASPRGPGIGRTVAQTATRNATNKAMNAAGNAVRRLVGGTSSAPGAFNPGTGANAMNMDDLTKKNSHNFATSMGGKDRSAVFTDPTGKNAISAEDAEKALKDGGSVGVATVAEKGVDPNGKDFESKLDANAVKDYGANGEYGENGLTMAYGSLTDADGTTQGVDFYKNEDTGQWTGITDDGRLIHPGDAPDGTSVDIFGGQPSGLTPESVAAAPGGTVHSAVEQLEKTAGSAFGEGYLGMRITSNSSNGTMSGVYCAADGTMKNFTAQQVSRSTARNDPNCIRFDNGTYARVTGTSTGGEAAHWTCTGGKCYHTTERTTGEKLNNKGKPKGKRS